MTKSEALSNEVNNWRLVPRLALIFYFFACYRIAEWFMTLGDPSTQQTSFATGIWGAAAAWFAFYVNSGKKSGKNNQPSGA